MTTVQTPSIRDQLAALVRQAIARAQADGQLPTVVMPEVTIERPAKAEQGDFATNFALRAQRAVGPKGPKPMEIAGAISAQIAQDIPPYLAGVEAAPPGFLNFTLADDWLHRQVDTILDDGPAFGSLALGEGARVQVEFVSANPTGPVHVGTARNAALGDSIARILDKAGWQVQREYYFNDAGVQMEHLARSVWKRYQQALGRPVELTDKDYQGDYIVELAQEILRTEGERFATVPESESEQIGALASKRIMAWIEADLTRARVSFDNWFSEARVIREGDFSRVLELLRERGLTYEREGAEWLKSQDLGDERDRVLIKSDGRPTYTATDIAYHYDKFFVRKFDRVVNVWGADHQGQVPSLKAIVRALGGDPDRLDIILYQMVKVLRRGEVVEMSKRSGTFVTLAELLDEVGVDATRWFLVARSADTAMEFDLDLAAKQSSDNPVYYVQYAHARLARVLSDEAAADWRSGDVSLLTQPAELAMIRRMLQLPEIVELAAKNLAPHHMPHYAYELARATQAWYDSGNDDRALRILAEDPAIRNARLKLAAAARQVLASALDLIGVLAPDSM
ncbi:MAG TPA: arginine--tRNA ligase [Chloroflexota bacterium]|nr:arginine--tRNA ligase [Chloroflexota bacterium]